MPVWGHTKKCSSVRTTKSDLVLIVTCPKVDVWGTELDMYQNWNPVYQSHLYRKIMYWNRMYRKCPCVPKATYPNHKPLTINAIPKPGMSMIFALLCFTFYSHFCTHFCIAFFCIFYSLTLAFVLSHFMTHDTRKCESAKVSNYKMWKCMWKYFCSLFTFTTFLQCTSAVSAMVT